MASSINASTSGAGGVITTADNSGILNLQSNGTTVATVSSTGFSTPANQTINTANTFGFKNRIINGGMTIDQRNAGASVTQTSSLPYTVDRWRIYGPVNSKFTAQQNAGSVTPPAGFTNYLGITSSAATTPGSGDGYRVEQPIEGYNIADLGFGTANAKTLTISFWVRSSLTGTFGGALWNVDATRSYPFSYTISSANTWEQKTVTFTGDTTGTWNSTNGQGLVLEFSMGAGSALQGTAGSWASTLYTGVTGQTNVVATNGATWYVTGVQLEVGSQATSFDFRSIGQEFLLCQRYYQQTVPYGSLLTTVGAGGYRGSIAYATDQAAGGFYFVCEMRTTPTVTLYSSNGTSGVWTKPGNVNSGATSANAVGTNGFMYLIGSSFTANTILYGSWSASAEL